MGQFAEYIGMAEEILPVLAKHGVTFAELLAILEAAGEIVPILTKHGVKVPDNVGQAVTALPQFLAFINPKG